MVIMITCRLSRTLLFSRRPASDFVFSANQTIKSLGGWSCDLYKGKPRNIGTNPTLWIEGNRPSCFSFNLSMHAMHARGTNIKAIRQIHSGQRKNQYLLGVPRDGVVSFFGLLEVDRRTLTVSFSMVFIDLTSLTISLIKI